MSEVEIGGGSGRPGNKVLLFCDSLEDLNYSMGSENKRLPG